MSKREAEKWAENVLKRLEQEGREHAHRMHVIIFEECAKAMVKDNE